MFTDRRRRYFLRALGMASGIALVATSAGGQTGSSERDCKQWGMYGRTHERTFSIDDDGCSPIDRTTVPSLVPLWFTKTAGTVTASPAVVEGVVYVGDWSGTMYALDGETGTTLWTFETAPAPGAAFGPIVSSAAVADVELDDEGTRVRLVIFGSGPHLYALDASDGSVVWDLYVGAGIPDEPTEIESSPVVADGVVYVGMDTHNLGDEVTGGVRGGVLAVGARSGDVLWKFEPENPNQGPYPQPGAGPNGFGCGGVWSSPALDLSRHPPMVVFGTANCESDDPAAWNAHAEAVTALRADDGTVLWSFQPHERNRRDWDFGATPNFFTDRNGRAILGIGNKDGSYYALDPADGSLLWSRAVVEPGDLGEDSSIGGFIGSTGVFGGDVFGGTAIGGPFYFHALDGATGEDAWPLPAPSGPTYAATSIVNGVVFNGALDDVFKAFDAETGLLLWAMPLAGPISSSAAIADDTVYVGSGTASSDACVKGIPGITQLCDAVLGDVLGQAGGVHAFRLPVSDP